jgi:hypothetical protein
VKWRERTPPTLTKLGRNYLYIEMVAKLVARLLAMAAGAQGLNPDISQKYKMGDISKGIDKTTVAALATTLFYMYGTDANTTKNIYISVVCD